MIPSDSDEALTSLVKDLSDLAAAAKNQQVDDNNLLRFSQLITNLKDLRLQLQSQQITQLNHGITADILQKLDPDIESVRKVIDDYDSTSLLERVSISPLFLSKLSQSAKSMSFKPTSDGEANSFLDSSATSSPSPRASIDDDFPSHESSFSGSFDGELLSDPVSVSCGESFERRVIEEHLRLGNYWCPKCYQALSPMEKLTPNIALRNFILEKKQRYAIEKLRLAGSLLYSEDLESVNRALEDLKDAMTEIPSCLAKAKDNKLIPVLALLLKNSLGDTRTVLCCLLLIARFSDENKVAMGRTGVIRCLMKLLHGSDPEPYALEILLEFSEKEAIADKIGNDPNSIPTLVALLNDQTDAIVKMARAVLENLSRIHFTVTMAKCGYISPFLECFCRGNSEETRASLANELTQMKLSEVAARSLENDQFITSLIDLLNCGSSSSRSASLRCIKKLIDFTDFKFRFLSNEFAIPAILSLITTAPEQQCKQELVEILVSLLQISQPTDHQNNPRLQVLYTRNTIKTLLLQIETSGPEDQISLLKLLLLIVQKSDSTRKRIKSEDGSISCLFSALKRDQDSVRLEILKLIYYIAVADPDNEIYLPPSPAKDSFVNPLIAILTHSRVEEEISAVVGIIGCLPKGDYSIDEMLQKSSFLKNITSIFSLTIISQELLENSLAALQRYLAITDSVPNKHVSKLHPHLVQMLSNGASPFVKQRAAINLSYLARCNSTPSSSFSQLRQRIPNMLQTSKGAFCPVHLPSSSQHSICLIKSGAVRPLVEMMRIMDSGASAAASTTLNTICIQCDSTSAVDAIVESGGADAIVEVLERRGPVFVKEAALELLERISKHRRTELEGLDDKFKKVLVYILSTESSIKLKAASVLAEIGL